jgi:hypothetical protein
MIDKAAGGDMENYYVVAEHMHTETFLRQIL